jgi:hypothetical protein
MTGWLASLGIASFSAAHFFWKQLDTHPDHPNA